MMKAMELLERRQTDGFHWEARRIVDEGELAPESLPAIEFSLRHRAFMEVIRPLIRQKVFVDSLARMTIDQTGHVERHYTNEQRALLVQVDEMIAEAARQHGLAQTEV